MLWAVESIPACFHAAKRIAFWISKPAAKFNRETARRGSDWLALTGNPDRAGPLDLARRAVGHARERLAQDPHDSAASTRSQSKEFAGDAKLLKSTVALIELARARSQCPRNPSS
jgi:hypothetical protein